MAVHLPIGPLETTAGRLLASQFLTYTFRTSCCSTRLSWAHIPCYRLVREDGVEALHLPVGPLKPRSGLEPLVS